MVHKRKINKLDLIKLNTFTLVKDTLKRMRKKPKDWEKIFTDHIPHNRHIQNIQRTQNLIRKETTKCTEWVKDLNRSLTKE